MADELVKHATNAIVPFEDFLTTETPASIDTGELGSEGIGREDITMPRIGIAQKMSPEIDPTSPRYIDGLKFTDLYHTGEKKSLGQGPVHFSILKRLEPRYIEFYPIESGGGVKEFDVPKDDPRTQFTVDRATGKKTKPVATMFYDFIVLLLNDLDMSNPNKNVVALSFKSSGLKAAKKLNYLITSRPRKLLPKGVYKIWSGKPQTDKNSGGTYAVYDVDNAGWLKEESAVEKYAISAFESWKDRAAPKIDVDATTEEVVVDDSMAANQEDMPAM